MNLNPFNYQKPAQWGPDAQRHLKNIADAQKAEASNGQFYSKKYEGKPADGEKLVETSKPEDIKRWLETPPGNRGSLTL